MQKLRQVRALTNSGAGEDADDDGEVDSGIRILIVQILEVIPDQFQLGEDKGDILELVLDQGGIFHSRSESENDFLRYQF